MMFRDKTKQTVKKTLEDRRILIIKKIFQRDWNGFSKTWIRRQNHTYDFSLFLSYEIILASDGIIWCCDIMPMSIICASQISSTSCLAMKVKRNGYHSVPFDNLKLIDITLVLMKSEDAQIHCHWSNLKRTVAHAGFHNIYLTNMLLS